MIAYLKGNLIHKSPEFVILDVNGVGYKAHVPLSTFGALPGMGETLELHIHTNVREDAIKLFGFFSEMEKILFETLITINKVGPKLALTILSGIPPEDLLNAVAQEDAQRLGAVPGIGPKTAQRLIIEMKDKLKNLPLALPPKSALPHAGGPVDDALSALVNLGYKKPEAEKALKRVIQRSGPDGSLEDLIKESLTVLS